MSLKGVRVGYMGLHGVRRSWTIPFAKMPILWVFETDVFVVQKGLFATQTSKIVFSGFIFTIYDMGIEGVTRGYMGLHGVTRGYKGLQGVSGVTVGYNDLKTVTGGYKRLQGVTRGYTGLQGVTGGYISLQGVTVGYLGFHGVTRGNKVLPKGYRGFQRVQGLQLVTGA